MRLLLDSHVLLWWFTADAALSSAAYTAISDQDNAVFVSAASAWEIATKHRVGKLPIGAAIAADLEAAIASQGFAALPITFRHAQLGGALPGPHRDPFDRMLIAQALLEHLVLVSNETPFDAYGITRLW